MTGPQMPHSGAWAESSLRSVEEKLRPVLRRLYPRWGRNSPCEAGLQVSYEGRIYRCRRTHRPQKGQEPPKAPALWEEVAEAHLGTCTDPIPFHGGQRVHPGLCYCQEGTVYLCRRGTVLPVYHPLKDLSHLYVKEVQKEELP